MATAGEAIDLSMAAVEAIVAAAVTRQTTAVLPVAEECVAAARFAMAEQCVAAARFAVARQSAPATHGRALDDRRRLIVRLRLVRLRLVRLQLVRRRPMRVRRAQPQAAERVVAATAAAKNTSNL